MMKRVLAIGLVAALSACTSYQMIPAGGVEFTGKDAVTNTAVPWNGRGRDNQYTWTQDGPLLQNLVFHIGIEDGKTLTQSLDVEDKFDPLQVLIGKVPDLVSYRFQKSMTEPEIMDLFAASYGKIIDAPISTANLRPATLGGQPGFRFDYAFTGKDEVRRKGFAVGAVVDSRLTLVHYYGTEMYHFQKNSADAEQVVAAFRFKNKG